MINFLTELFKDQDYDKNNFFLIAGPCVVESEELVTEVADKVFAICKKHEVNPYQWLRYTLENIMSFNHKKIRDLYPQNFSIRPTKPS